MHRTHCYIHSSVDSIAILIDSVFVSTVVRFTSVVTTYHGVLAGECDIRPQSSNGGPWILSKIQLAKVGCEKLVVRMVGKKLSRYARGVGMPAAEGEIATAFGWQSRLDEKRLFGIGSVSKPEPTRGDRDGSIDGYR